MELPVQTCQVDNVKWQVSNNPHDVEPCCVLRHVACPNLLYPGSMYGVTTGSLSRVAVIVQAVWKVKRTREVQLPRWLKPFSVYLSSKVLIPQFECSQAFERLALQIDTTIQCALESTYLCMMMAPLSVLGLLMAFAVCAPL